MTGHNWVDGHLDLAYVAALTGDLRCEPSPSCQRSLSLGGLSRGRVGLVAATIFVEPGAESRGKPWGYEDHDDWVGANRAALLQIAHYEQMEREGLVHIVRSREDLDRDDRLRLVLLMEGADPIRDADDVERWHQLGVRMVGLSWAHGSRFTGGNAQPGRMTQAGREVVTAFDELSILHDASHLSDESFDDLMSTTPRMVVASHSNARALMRPIERHITDSQVRAIASRGGVVGLNLYGKFLAQDRPATLADAVAHIEHIASAAGTRAISALGSDLDGGFAPDVVPAELRYPDRYDALTTALATHGWSTTDCAALSHGNWMRVFRAAIPAQTIRQSQPTRHH